jgi:hypothetical protein
MWVNAWAYMRMDKQQRWWNFEWNYADTVQNQINLPKKVIIKDDTLREGEETPGSYFTIEQKIEIAKLLEEMGIPEIEVGYAAGIKEHADTFKALKKEGIKMKLSSHARLYVEDVKKEVDDILAAEADHVNFLLVPSPVLKNKNDNGRNRICQITRSLCCFWVGSSYTKILGKICKLGFRCGS